MRKIVIESIRYFVANLPGTVSVEWIGTVPFRRTTAILCNQPTNSYCLQKEYQQREYAHHRQHDQFWDGDSNLLLSEPDIQSKQFLIPGLVPAFRQLSQDQAIQQAGLPVRLSNPNNRYRRRPNQVKVAYHLSACVSECPCSNRI
jgi:hypothetical protein